MKILFVEPPRDFWFVMGEYLPPPFGIIQLATYLEREVKEAEIEILDCTAQRLGWSDIEKDYDITKRMFGKKINFVGDQFKRQILFRDVEHAYVLANLGFSKPAVILAGGIIEELLSLYLQHKKIKPNGKTFN